eukprot:m.47648 g.47648  ORF g.47648 m.47648 type:complete len:63 (+) comp47599_c0_seq2:741-929(+)
MVHLKRQFNWEMADVVYQPVYDSHSEEFTTKHDYTLMGSPDVVSLPTHLQVTSPSVLGLMSS